MAHTTLASTDRALEKIGDFVAVQDYASELVEDLENDFPRLMEQRRGLIRDDAATRGP